MDEHPVLLTEPPHNPTSHCEQLAEAFFKTVPYQLPGGQVVELGDEQHRAPEVLFRPSLLGSEALPVHDVLLTAIRRSDLDLRATLFANVVLAGGTTMLLGLGDSVHSSQSMLLQSSPPCSMMTAFHRRACVPRR